MTRDPDIGSVVLVGCGRLGSAIVEGWLTTGAIDPGRMIILTPSEKPVAEAARARGARINPPLDALAQAQALVLAVKPAMWREAVRPFTDRLNPGAIILSVMAGVRAGDLSGAMQGCAVARVMPTTAVARGKGVAAVWSGVTEARALARGLFAPLADVVDLDHEAQIDVATAVAASAPAFIYAFVEALARAGVAQGLPADAARRLARGALRSAGASAETGEALAVLTARIASPGGTTRAGLDALAATSVLDLAADAAIKAAVERAKAL